MEFSNLPDDDDQNVGVIDEGDEDEMEGFHETDTANDEEIGEEKKVDSTTDFDDDAAKNDW